MNTVIEKKKLLDIIRANKTEHRDTYEAAKKAYKQKGIELLERLIGRLRDGNTLKPHLDLPIPEDHTEDYDRAIQMLVLDSRENIELNEQEFRQFVQDEWDWKRQWQFSTSSYVE